MNTEFEKAIEIYKAMANFLFANRPDVYEDITNEYSNIADGLLALEKVKRQVEHDDSGSR